MTYAIDVPTLEAAIVRQCSPTLAGLKPAGLFTFPGPYTSDNPAEQPAIRRRREALLEVVDRLRSELAPAGIELRVLTWRSCGALVYLYRPTALAAHLADPRAARRLRALGYRPRDLEASLELLAARIAGSGGRARAEAQRTGAAASDAARACPCTLDACRHGFPHEIGFFLGYPYADVVGFIDNGGQNYLAVGLWKVYDDVEAALATFARYRRCTSALQAAYQHGGQLSRLAVCTG